MAVWEPTQTQAEVLRDAYRVFAAHRGDEDFLHHAAWLSKVGDLEFSDDGSIVFCTVEFFESGLGTEIFRVTFSYHPEAGEEGPFYELVEVIAEIWRYGELASKDQYVNKVGNEWVIKRNVVDQPVQQQLI